MTSATSACWCFSCNVRISEHFVLDFKINHFYFLGEGPHKVISKNDKPLFESNRSTEALFKPRVEHKPNVPALFGEKGAPSCY